MKSPLLRQPLSDDRIERDRSGSQAEFEDIDSGSDKQLLWTPAGFTIGPFMHKDGDGDHLIKSLISTFHDVGRGVYQMAGFILGRKGSRVGIEKTAKKIEEDTMVGARKMEGKRKTFSLQHTINICGIWSSDTRFMISMIRFNFTFSRLVSYFGLWGTSTALYIF